MKAVAAMYMEQAKKEAKEWRAKASAASFESAKTFFLEMAEKKDSDAFRWELLAN